MYRARSQLSKCIKIDFIFETYSFDSFNLKNLINISLQLTVDEYSKTYSFIYNYYHLNLSSHLNVHLRIAFLAKNNKLCH